MKRGLGKGLDALFAIYDNPEEDNNIKDIVKNTENTIKYISIGEIDPDVNQPRKKFDDEALNDLANSIKIHGVISPIVVTPRNNRYMIIAGERRWRASRIAGEKTIPCIVRDYTDRQIREISLVENLQREDLNPIEEAMAIKELMDVFSWTHEEVAERLGKSRPAITNTVRLLNLEPEVIKMVEEGKLSAGHARSLLAVTDKKAQIKLANQVKERVLTVRDLEKVVKSTKKPTTTTNNQSIELREFSRELSRIFGTKASIIGDDNRGRIVIDYFNKDDLERFYELVQKIKQ